MSDESRVSSLESRIAELETKLRQVTGGAANATVQRDLAAFSAGSCTNNCTAACTIGCTKGCTDGCAAQPIEMGDIVSRVQGVQREALDSFQRLAGLQGRGG
jgi:hypothetical protein